MRACLVPKTVDRFYSRKASAGFARTERHEQNSSLLVNSLDKHALRRHILRAYEHTSVLVTASESMRWSFGRIATADVV